MERLLQIAEANTALSVSNFKGAVAIPSALGLDPAAAKCVLFSRFYFSLCGFQVARNFHCGRLKCSNLFTIVGRSYRCDHVKWGGRDLGTTLRLQGDVSLRQGFARFQEVQQSPKCCLVRTASTAPFWLLSRNRRGPSVQVFAFCKDAC